MAFRAVPASMYLFPPDWQSVAGELQFDCPITTPEQIASEATRAAQRREATGGDRC